MLPKQWKLKINDFYGVIVNITNLREYWCTVFRREEKLQFIIVEAPVLQAKTNQAKIGGKYLMLQKFIFHCMECTSIIRFQGIIMYILH